MTTDSVATEIQFALLPLPKVVSVDCEFQPVVYLFGCYVSDVIHHLCPSLLFLIDDDTNSEWMASVKTEWKLRSYSTVSELCLSVVNQTPLNAFACINYELAYFASQLKMTQKEDQEEKQQVINNNNTHPNNTLQLQHWNKVCLLFDNCMDCIYSHCNLNDNQLLLLYANMIIILFQTKKYSTARKYIRDHLFTKFDSRPIFRDIPVKCWADLITFFKNAFPQNEKEQNNGNSNSKQWFIKYNAILVLFVLYICVELHLCEDDSEQTSDVVLRSSDSNSVTEKTELTTTINNRFADIAWIIECLLTQNAMKAYTIPIKDELFVILSLSAMRNSHFENAIIQLKKCTDSCLGLSLFLQGWIFYYHLKQKSKCRWCWKQCVMHYSFEVAQCANFFANMFVAHSNLKSAEENVRRAIDMDKKKKKSNQLFLLNLIQILMLKQGYAQAWSVLRRLTDDYNGNNNSNNDNNATNVSVCRSWEQVFSWSVMNNDISNVHIKRIQCQLHLCQQQQYRFCCIEYQSMLKIAMEPKLELQIYHEYCCVLIKLKHWQILLPICDMYAYDFELQLTKIQCYFETKDYDKALVATQTMQSKFIGIRNRSYAESTGTTQQLSDRKRKDFAIIFWWFHFYSGLISMHSAVNDEPHLENAITHFENALVCKSECFLTHFLSAKCNFTRMESQNDDNGNNNHNITAQAQSTSEMLEIALFWLDFINIPFNESSTFYETLSENNNKLLKNCIHQKWMQFQRSLLDFQPSQCKLDGGNIFACLLQCDGFRIHSVEVVNITKKCLVIWQQCVTILPTVINSVLCG